MPIHWVRYVGGYPPSQTCTSSPTVWVSNTVTASSTWTISNGQFYIDQVNVTPTTITLQPSCLWITDQTMWENDVEAQVGILQRDLASVQLSNPHVRDSYRQEQLRLREAEERARELLLASLTPEQRASLQRDKWFVVEGKSGRRYRVHDNGHVIANIAVFERDLLGHERTLHRLCGHIGDHGVPLADHLLAQKLMLEADEDAFLRLANQHP